MLANVYEEGNQVKVKAWFLTPHTIGSGNADSAVVRVAETTGLAVANRVVLAGAGPEGLHLVATIASIAGLDVTISTPVVTPVRWAVFGKLTDPTATTFKVEQPDGVLVTKVAPDATIQLVEAGLYVLTYDPPAGLDGTYIARVEGTGTAKGAAEREFRLRSSRIV